MSEHDGHHPPAHAAATHAPTPDSDHSAPLDRAAPAEAAPGPAAVDAVNPVLAQALALQGQIAAQVAQAKLSKTIQAIPVATRLAIDSRHIPDDGDRHDFLLTLDKIEDPDVRREALEQFQAQTGQSVHDFVTGNGDFEKRDATAVDQLISPDRDKAERDEAEMSPQQRKDLDLQAAKWADELVTTGAKTDANDDDNAAVIFRTLGPRTPVEMEAIRRQVRNRTGGHLTAYEAVDWHMKGANEDEAVQELSGDRVNNAIAGICNSEGNPGRLKEILRELKPEELAKLRSQEFVKMFPALGAEGDEDEIKALLHGDKTGADAAHLQNLLDDPLDDSGLNGLALSDQQRKTNAERAPENVLKEFQAMSPQDVVAAKEDWDKKHADGKWWDGGDHRSFEDMVEERFKDDPVGEARMKALLAGNRAESRALELQQGIDTRNDKEIEDAAANHDLGLAQQKNVDPKDVGRMIAAELEQQQTDIAFLAHDSERARRANKFFGANETGQNVSQAMGQYFDDQRKQLDAPRSMSAAVDIAHDPDKVWKEHDEKVHDAEVGADELWSQGSLSLATQIHRARSDEKKTAELAEGIATTQDYDDAQADAQKKYHTDLLPSFGDKLYTDMNANQKKIFNVEQDGVVSARKADVEVQDELDVYKEELSGSMEQHDAIYGGGTQDATAWMIDAHADQVAANGQLKAGVMREDFDSRSEGVNKALATQEEEKIKFGERNAHAFGTVMKLVGLLTADPLLIAAADAAGGLGEIAIKEEDEGEAYHAKDDWKHLGSTMAGDAAFFGVSELHEAANLEAAEKVAGADKTLERAQEAAWDAKDAEQMDKRVDELRKAQKEKGELEEAAESVRSQGNTAASLTKNFVTTTMDDAMGDKSANQTGLDLLLGSAGIIVPGLLGGEVEKLVGKSDKARAAASVGKAVEYAQGDNTLGKGLGALTDLTAGVALDPEHDVGDKLLEMGGDKYNESKMNKHNAKAPPKKQWQWSSNAYSWKAPEHEEKRDGE